MPKRTYALEPGADPRLMISWRYGWNDCVIQLDGHTIGKLDHRSLLEEGREFATESGKLRVQLVPEENSMELHVSLNDISLKASSTDPQIIIGKTAGALFLFGGGITLLGLLASFFQIDSLIQQGFNAVNSLFGILFILLGVLVKENSRYALIAAIGLIAADAVQMLLSALDAGHPPLLSIALRIALITWLSQGFSAMRKLQKSHSSKPMH